MLFHRAFLQISKCTGLIDLAHFPQQMKRLLILLVLLTTYGVQSPRAQSVKSDSLEARLPLVEMNERVPILIELVELNSRNPEKAFSYGDEAEKLLDIYPDLIQESLLNVRIGWTHYYLGEHDEALERANQSEKIALSVPHSENMARAKLLRGRVYRDTNQFDLSLATLDSALVLTEESGGLLRSSILNEAGSVHRRLGDSPKALELHTEALELVESDGDQEALTATYTLLGINHDIIGNYDEALRYHLLSLDVKDELNDRRGMAASMTNLGILHQRLEQYPEALDFYEQALEIWKELDAKDPLASTLNNIGAVYELMEEYETARGYYEEAHEIWSETANPYDLSISLNNLGTIHQYLGDFEQALNFKKQVFDIHLELGNVRGSSSVLRDIAVIYHETDQPDSAMATAQRSLEYATESGSWQQIRNAHEVISELYEDSGDYEHALEHYRLFRAANDTLFNADSQSVIAELQEQYRTRQQQQEIELLQQERELQQLWFYLMIGGFATAFIVAGFLYNRYQLKVKNREKLHVAEIEKKQLAAENAEAKTKLLDAENRRKSKELEDARTLQLSMLPATLPELPNATMTAFMNTAAEVGGDYYDVDLADDGTLTLCIGDATGHGTKAGLLVMAVKSLFGLMAHEEDLKTVLQRSSLAIKKMNLPQLYMAFAMARLKGNTLELIGAGMPPAHIYRAESGEVETVDLKGMPLGSVPDFPYETKTITLHSNDVLLLLSDGYPELISQNDEMLGYNQATTLLAVTGHLSPEEILDRFKTTAHEWLQDNRPNDDMTFMVVKMG